jgi:signal transduction histidine kinase
LKIKQRRLGIKWNLFLSFVLFSGILLVLLWLFQIVFLDDFYKAIKTASIKNTADTIATNIENEDLPTLLDRLAQNNDVFILILDENGNKLNTVENTPGNLIFKMAPGEIQKYLAEAAAANGSVLDQIDLSAFRNDHYRPDQFSGRVPGPDEGMGESIIYGEFVTLSNGTRNFILLNTILTPIFSTVETLRTQLLFITAILVVLSLGLALVLSKRFARPIIRINNRSKELAQGNYTADFEPSGYKEIAELADTLNHAARELNQVETLRRELIANVSHDLRTPLTMISGYAEVMRDLPGENNPENVQVIIDEARRLTGLVNDLLDLSRLQAGSQKLDLQTYSLTDSIRSILDRYSKLIEQEGFNLKFESDQNALVHADELRIGQVLYNLINNAISYTGEDKRVTVRQTVADGWVRVEIIDSGEGIPADQLPHIWDRYYKAEKTHHRAIVGTGLGLSIVKAALELHQVPYGVDCSPDTGSVFWFKLPLAKILLTGSSTS